MADFRTTIFLAIIFLALGAYVSTIEMPAMEAETARRADAQRLLRFDYRDVTHLVYATQTERIEMSRGKQNRWRILEPIAARGDAREIGKVLRALELGRVARVIQDTGTTLKPYGLQSPRVTMTITTMDAVETLALGDTGPLSSTLYAQRGSDENIVLTTLSVTDFRKKNLHTFRLKDIVLFNPTDAEHIQLQTPDQTIILQRGMAFHGPVPTWNFSSPIQAPADKTAVGILLMTLQDLTATGFIDSQADQQALLNTLHAPWLTVTVQTKRKSHSVTFFPPATANDDAYVVTSANEPMYRIPSETLKQLPREVFPLQDKRLFGMAGGDIALLTVKTDDRRYTLIRQHGEWYLEGRESERINQQKVSLFVSRLVDLPAEVSVSPTKSHLEQYALASPILEIIGIDNKGRRRGHLALGTRGKGLVYAVGSGLPGIYQARSIILTQIPSPESLVASDSRSRHATDKLSTDPPEGMKH